MEELESCSCCIWLLELWLMAVLIGDVAESSPQAAKSEAERIAPVKAKEMREILCIA